MSSVPGPIATTACLLRFARPLLPALAVIGLFALPAPAAETDFHYLAADPSLRAETANVAVTLGQANYVGEVLGRDQAWENAYQIGYPGTVLRDPTTGQWRMYYEMCVPGQEFQRGIAMATSNDGIHWTKPALNVTGTTYTAEQNNNFVPSAADLDGAALPSSSTPTLRPISDTACPPR